MPLCYSRKPEMLYDCSSNTVWIGSKLHFLLKTPDSQTCAATFTLTRCVDGSNKNPHSNQTPKPIQPFLPDAFRNWPCLFLCLVSFSLSWFSAFRLHFLSVEAQIPSCLRAVALTALSYFQYFATDFLPITSPCPLSPHRASRRTLLALS